MTTIYTVKDILQNKKLKNNSTLDDFIITCREYLADISEPKNKSERDIVETRTQLRSLGLNEKFCYDVDNKICISRKVIEKLQSNASIKKVIANKYILATIKSISGISVASVDMIKYHNLRSSDTKLSTKLKQEFTCIAIDYVFRNPRASIYDFLFDIETNNITPSTNVIISNNINDFREFSYNQNFLNVADSFANGKTIYANRTKLKMGNISNYKIAEESSANHLKEDPFRRIKSTEQNYYQKADKLTTADIYLYDDTNKIYTTMMNVFRRRDRRLTHNQYRHFINHAFMDGVVIPISLKQLIIGGKDTTNNKFVTNRFKIVGSYKLEQSKSLEDDFMSAAVDLFSTNTKQTFIRKISNLIEIEFNAARLGIDSKGMWIPFKTKFKKGQLKGYELWFTSGQIHVDPEGTTSNSGLGGISREYLFENVILKLPKKASFISSLVRARKDIFSQYMNISAVKAGKILSEGDFKSIINELQKDNNVIEVKNILFDYVNRLTRNMKSVPNLNFNDSLNSFMRISNNIEHYAQKMSMFEMASYVVAHENIVHDWIKNSFIMSIYGLTSAIGLIIFDGRHVNLKKIAATERMKRMGNRINPMYLKIGF
jgi:hypothetical protein